MWRWWPLKVVCSQPSTERWPYRRVSNKNISVGEVAPYTQMLSTPVVRGIAGEPTLRMGQPQTLGVPAKTRSETATKDV
ncbi:hypothetical protein BsWGS_13115 [Bradybaena similaris]